MFVFTVCLALSVARCHAQRHAWKIHRGPFHRRARSVQPSFCGGYAPQKLLLRLLALASLNRACRDLVPAFPQRSPPWYLAIAAYGGLRSAHDCRPRRALLHYSHSWASPIRRRRTTLNGLNLGP